MDDAIAVRLEAIGALAKIADETEDEAVWSAVMRAIEIGLWSMTPNRKHPEGEVDPNGPDLKVVPLRKKNENPAN